MSGFLDYYDLLEVQPDSSIEVIKKNFRRLAHKYHPDKNNQSTDSQMFFRSIVEAYNVLTSAEGRTDYDNYIRTSPIVRKQSNKGSRKPPNAEQTVEDLKSQLNYILWEIEDIISKPDSIILSLKINNFTVENRLIYILAFFDKWILNPAGMGDYFFTARQIDIDKPYNPMDNGSNRAHKPYVDLTDYFFQIRRRFDRFLNRIVKNDLSLKIPKADVTLLDCIFEAVNLSFHYLGNINMAAGGESRNYSPYLFSKNIFDDKQIKLLKGSV